jgi:membrane protease YdiL (CAAX protease family)
VTKNSKLAAWLTLLAFLVAFAAVYAAVKYVQALLMPHIPLEGPREIAAFRGASGVVLVWAELGATLLVMRLRGQTLADLGWWKSSSIWGWLAAFVAVVVYAGFALMGPMLKGAPLLTDWSAFRIAMALGIGISAGICEETMFRGFVMRQARDGGAPVVIQVLLSTLFFGLAHLGWGGAGGRFDLPSMIGAMISTSILGLMLAIAYAVGRRSLIPVVAAHAAIDIIIEPWLMLFAVSGGFQRLTH